MTALSVNINKIATLRNARGQNTPNVYQWAQKIIAHGGQGITVHPRPDQRHITQSDVKDLAGNLSVEFNIEGYPSKSFVEMIVKTKPAQVTLVPDKPGQLTSDHGWDTIKRLDFLVPIIAIFKENNIRSSIFLDPIPALVPSAKATGADRIELYTESYAKAYGTAKQAEVTMQYTQTAAAAIALGLGINAGHDLNLNNLSYFIKNVPNVLEVSIGHALICDALEMGMEKTIKAYLEALK